MLYRGRMDMMHTALCTLLVWVCSSPRVYGAKILILPFPWKSHVFEVTAIGDALHARGHELSIVLPPSYPDIAKARKWSNYEVIEYELAEPDFFSAVGDDSQSDTYFDEVIKMTPIQDFRENVEGFIQFCSNPLRDEALYERLAAARYDLALVDAFPGSRCLMVLPYRLGLPYVTLATQYEPWLLRTPALPSHVPFPLGGHYTERMTLRERVESLAVMLDWALFPRVPYLADDFIARYIPAGLPRVSLTQLAHRSLLWLVDTDVVLDYPRPTMANEVNIGGLSTTAPARPLSRPLQAFLDGAPPEGAIVVSFGSTDSLGKRFFRKMLSALSAVPQRVIWRHANIDPAVEIPPHIKLLDWIPQNDILGHPKVKLFVTHCGTNGQFEAVFHAVPMVGLPIFGDQPYNARRMAYRGYGRHLDLLTFTPETLAEAIRDVTGNQSYYDNIRRASEIFKSRHLAPSERAAYRVEEVLRFGGGHLHSHALDMPWHEYLMLDLLCLLHVLVIAIIGTLLAMCFCVIRCWRGAPAPRPKLKQR